MDELFIELAEEQVLSDCLSEIIQVSIDTKDQEMIGFIRSLWNNEKWNSIVDKFNTEGSVWCVWWMDGVRAFSRVYENCP